MFVLTKLSSNLAQLAHSKTFHGVCALFAIALIGVALMASPPQSRVWTRELHACCRPASNRDTAIRFYAADSAYRTPRNVG